MTGSGALGGCGTKLVVLLVLGVLLLYLVLPLVIESLIAWRLQTALEQTALEAPTKPDVEVRSKFPHMMLLGSIDRVQVSSDQIGTYYDARVKLSGVSVSVPSLIVGNLEYETERCFVKAQAINIRSALTYHQTVSLGSSVNKPGNSPFTPPSLY